MTEVKNRKKIANIVRKKIKDKKLKKTELVKKTGLSRHTIYKIILEGGREENYSFDSLLKLCKELDVKVFFI